MTKQLYKQKIENINREKDRELLELYNREREKSKFSDETLQKNNMRTFFAFIGFVFISLTIPKVFFTVGFSIVILAIYGLSVSETFKAYQTRKRYNLPLDRTFNLEGMSKIGLASTLLLMSLFFLIIYLTGKGVTLNYWVYSSLLIFCSSYFLGQISKHIFYANSDEIINQIKLSKNHIASEKKKWRTREKTPFRTWFMMQMRDWKSEISRDWVLYVIFIPIFIWMLLFLYKPKFGLIIAFKNYHPFLGITGSPWVGFDQFAKFLTHVKFGKVMMNTMVLNFYGIFFMFPVAIIFALMLNELKSYKFKKFVQTVSFLPYFISTVVVVGIFVDFFGHSGIINDLLSSKFGMERTYYLLDPQWSMAVYFAIGLYKNTGYGALIYIAALSSIDPKLYEAASIDGATKLQEIRHITIPSIVPTIVVMLILRIGRILNVGHERLYLLRNTQNAEKLEVLSTFVLSLTIDSPVPQYSYATAVGLFNTVVSLVMVTIANKIAKKTGNSLW